MELRLLKRIYLGLVIGFFFMALLFAWFSGSIVTVVVFPLSAVLGWRIGVRWLVPGQRRTTIARRRGQVMLPHLGWITGMSIVVGMYILPAILRPLGDTVENGVDANLYFAASVAILVVLLDVQRPGYPKN